MNIIEKLIAIQNDLKVMKGRKNEFGNFNFRNAEDIYNEAKPICKKYKCALNVSDDVVLVGDRFYIKSTATLYDSESEGMTQSSGLAREPLHRPKMDDSQVTGSSSSYARKYALNGLFCIGDERDADSDNNGSPETVDSEEASMIEMIERATSSDELKRVWADYKHMQSRPAVVEAMKKACEKQKSNKKQ